MSQNLIKHIQQYLTLKEEELNKLQCLKDVKAYQKKAFLLKEGEICRANYFVVKGCLRLYFINEKGNEQIIQFALENWWLSDYMSLLHATPAQFYIQTIEDCQIIALSNHEQEKLLFEVPKLERYFRFITQKAYAANQHRFKFMYGLSKEERYQHFLALFPQFVQRIPQYMLASYLGVTPEYLSELRKK